MSELMLIGLVVVCLVAGIAVSELVQRAVKAWQQR